MKKFGFTLSELIVALGVVGVVAAITIPLLGNILPDKDKIAVLKTYKIIKDINNDIKEDKSVWEIYPRADRGGWRHLGHSSYTNLVIDRLNVVEDSLPDNMNAAVISFDTIDGIHWSIAEPWNNHAIITIDLMDTHKNRCRYNAASCTNPGQFSFRIEDDELQVTPADPLTAAYLANKKKLNDKKADYNTAKNDNNTYSDDAD